MLHSVETRSFPLYFAKNMYYIESVVVVFVFIRTYEQFLDALVTLLPPVTFDISVFVHAGARNLILGRFIKICRNIPFWVKIGQEKRAFCENSPAQK
jgi:hypothetical protein